MMIKKKRKKSRRRANGVPVLFANPRHKKSRRRRKRARARTHHARKATRRRRRSNPARHFPHTPQRAASSSVARAYDSHIAAARSYAAGVQAGRKAKKKRAHRKGFHAHKLASLVKGKKGPFYRRKRKGGYAGIHSIFTRSNPLRIRTWLRLLRTGVFGGLGIVTARVGKNLYTRYVSAHVIGDGSSSVRQALSEALSVVSMAALTLGVDKALSKVPGRLVRPDDRLAFKFGGLAESGRHAVAAVVKRVKPDLSLDKYGLSGMGALAPADAFMGELENADAFMGELEEADSFAEA